LTMFCILAEHWLQPHFWVLLWLTNCKQKTGMEKNWSESSKITYICRVIPSIFWREKLIVSPAPRQMF
jgi:hypothetical protein